MATPRKAAAKRTTTRKTAAAKTTRKAPAKRAAAKKETKKLSSPAEKRPGPGRPPLLEVQPELQQKIETFVRSGAFPERAAVAVGISARTHYAWLELGRAEQDKRDAGEKLDDAAGMYLRYADAIDKATAEAEMLLMGNALRGGATGSASMQILERRFRDHWGVKAPPAPPAAPPGPSTAPTTGLDMLEQRRQERAREQAAR